MGATLIVEEVAGPRKEATAMVEITVKGEALTLLFLVLALVRALRYR